MLRFHIASKSGRTHIQHDGGPFEFGREARPGGPRRHVLADPYASRDHLRVLELPGGRARLENLSKSTPFALADGLGVPPGEAREVGLPTRLTVGETLIEISEPDSSPDAHTAATLRTLAPPTAAAGGAGPSALAELGEAPDAERLARWFERVVAVQKAAAGSPEFFSEAARALVELVGLEQGLILLRRDDGWAVVAEHEAEGRIGPPYSRSVLERVEHERRTLFGAEAVAIPSASLDGVAAVVAAPILDESGTRVVGVAYGSRRRRGEGTIRALEAQVVQVLAAAVAAGLSRQRGEAEASRRRAQFAQFFSADLARELDRDPALLEGRDREVTILSSDIRGFSRLAERLGPRDTCRLVRDFMDRLTDRIAEHGGVVVDYVGDGILAMWNAPIEQPDHAARACRAALAMLGELPGLNERWSALTGGELGLGIGVNTGQALVGNTGSRLKLKYGPLGHPVNLASRVEGATKYLGVPVLISGTTHEALRGSFATRRLCRARVVGVAGAVDLHELHAESAPPEWEASRDDYEAALLGYESGDCAGACRTLQMLLARPGGPLDLPTLALIGRAVEHLKAPSRTFDPVVDLGGK